LTSGIGIQELVLLFVIGLIILGPERLPRVATQIGRWVGRARRTANQLRYQLEREIALADIESSGKNAKKKTEAPDARESAPQDSAHAEAAHAEAAPVADAPGDETIARPPEAGVESADDAADPADRA
jgi:sec-independent protein translocase protein TatB